MQLFTYIGVGVVVGAALGLILTPFELDDWLIGTISGTGSAIAAWWAIRRTGGAAL